MPSKRVIYINGKATEINQVKVCDTMWQRIKGLLGTKQLERNEGIYILPCQQVHTFGMKYPIQVVFLNETLTIISIESLAPNQISKHVSKSSSVLEVHPEIQIFQMGDQISWK